MGEPALQQPELARYRGPSLRVLREKPHLSVSQVKSFLICPRRYRLQYVDRVEPAFRPVSLVLGSAFHHAVAAHFLDVDRHEPASRDQLQELLRQELVAALEADGPPVLFDDAEDEAKLLGTAASMLDAFLLGFPKVDEVLGVEQPFELDLVDPHTGEVLDLPLVGAVDAVVVEGGQTTVVELKTGKKRWAPDQLAFDIQLSAYAVAMRPSFGEVALLLAVATKTKVPALVVERPTRGMSDEADLVATAASVARAVAAGVDHPVRGWACRSCAWAAACR